MLRPKMLTQPMPLLWLRMSKEDDTSNGGDKDVDTIDTPSWLMMPKKYDTNNGVKVGDEHQMNALGSEVNIELKKPINVLEKKV
ncbi:uncharacterized protein E5676_scaffold1418G00140 [Cucumis melo var. makuwa]|uniref:Uncharacterized protein n=1 Tax=Cucumis melo var. makuwa TaxID=1194695 RepID=A0A5A7SSS4_CUCMM|nr:uncharacterized protein E6C27_scaffold400G00770 [Cucumis melo var. makuwa]TYK02808.1 uncharacterized protein E5676_scaffold1418G00140 [Cucumis melo var. makuwa]